MAYSPENITIINLQSIGCKKATKVAAQDDLTPRLELAVTYEWAQQLPQAQQVYQEILQHYPDNRPALLGMARVALADKIGNRLIGFISSYYKKIPMIMRRYKVWKILKKRSKYLIDTSKPIALCEANEGLRLRQLPKPH